MYEQCKQKSNTHTHRQRIVLHKIIVSLLSNFVFKWLLLIISILYPHVKLQMSNPIKNLMYFFKRLRMFFHQFTSSAVNSRDYNVESSTALHLVTGALKMSSAVSRWQCKYQSIQKDDDSCIRIHTARVTPNTCLQRFYGCHIDNDQQYSKSWRMRTWLEMMYVEIFHFVLKISNYSNLKKKRCSKIAWIQENSPKK